MTGFHKSKGRDETGVGNLLRGAVFSGIVLALIFQTFPDIDLAVSAALKNACGGDARHNGWCHENGALWLPRWLAMGASTLICMVAALMLSAAKGGGGLQRARCLFMLATFVLGPGLLTNVVLKDHWGRARPREVVELGGTKHFTAPLNPSSECEDNCSFVSGEAAGVFAPLFAASLLFPRLRLILLLGGVFAGTATGLVRVGTGGHFLSDVLFAGVFMALVVALAHRMVFGLHERWDAMSNFVCRALRRRTAIGLSSTAYMTGVPR